MLYVSKSLFVWIFSNEKFDAKKWGKYMSKDRIKPRNIIKLPDLTMKDRRKILENKRRNVPEGKIVRHIDVSWFTKTYDD